MEAMGEIKRVVVVGAGIMGHGFAQVFGLNGLDVVLVDQTDDLLQRARGWIRDNLQTMVELGELEPAGVQPALRCIQFSVDLAAAVQGADYVLEAVTENIEIKRGLFQRLGTLAPPEAVLATNTSSFDINEFARVTRNPERVIGTHWFHPSPITPCVEVIPADATSRETIELTVAFMERMGKFPTVCKSAPGFVANRIQFAMAAEALAIVEEGLATPQEVDRIVTSSFGFRLGAYGPFEICDQAGLATYRAVFDYLFKKIGREQFKPPGILDALVKQGRGGLNDQKGFYDYAAGAAESLKRERDRKLFARRRLFMTEVGRE
jgi:3-hydroxybutyryl-CoA dehydrogenase